ncbi:ABC transporter substrate-binding protein [Gulosibacter sp. 10]|uniref:ABC transporter substrate-binding protein n=1 Tax=Gulosibacter sp. 10 TaxID=1255570 RepID=UPI00097E841B|nr:extracellular solute-binding protein [Gulosibacter sp. 10]SJM55043.1 ABC-type Fe3+ transport system, periplasmic component [Gulosibacter sp. 10]
MNRKRTTGLAAAAAAALLLAGCSGGGGGAAAENVTEDGQLVIDGQLIADAELFAAAQEEGSLTFYTGGSEVSEQQAAEAFTEATGIDVDIVRLAPNKLNERILSEQAAGQLAADVIRISGEDLIEGIADAGAFAPTTLSADVADGLFEEAVYDDGLYYSSFDRVYSFGYNSQIVEEADAPQNWEDLLDPKWDGQIGIVQVGAGGSTAALTRFQFDRLGEEWMEGLAANNPRIYDSSAALTDGLARGEISIGTIPIATGYSAVLDGAPISIATPEEGAAAYPFYLGQTQSASNPAAAEVFVNWLLSDEGQALAASIGDFPVREGAPNPSIGDIELPSADSDFVFRSTLEESLDNLEPDADKWAEIFGYTG